MYLLVLVLLVVSVSSNLPTLLSKKGIRVVTPNDAEYTDITASYNRRFIVQPAAVVFPETVEQVSHSIRIGSGLGYNVVARSGGHSYIANGLGGNNGSIVIDLGNMDNVAFNMTTNIASVGTGSRLGDVALALGEFGRAIPHGTCPYVGIGGHSAYGGYGFTSRMWGLTLDNIASIDVVLANGTIALASADNNVDLFWALRGAGGSFGITTSVNFHTRKSPPSGVVFTYTWILNTADATKAFNSFQKFVQSDELPSEIGPMLFFFPGAPKGFVLWGLTGGWYGDSSLLNATLAPFLDLMPPPTNIIHQEGTFIESLAFPGGGFINNLNTSLAPDAHDTFYMKSLMTPNDEVVSTQAWEAFASYLANEGNSTTLSWIVEIEVWGGKKSAIKATPLDETAFAHRSSLFTFQLYASSATREPPYPKEGYRWVEGLTKSLTDNHPSNWDYGAYPNYVDDQLDDWQHRYYNSHYLRLQSIKTAVDPLNVFSFPTSIEQL